MTTALTIHSDERRAVAAPQAPAMNFAELMHFAEMLVPTGILPDWIKQPGQVVAVVMTGRELGMEPMRALRSLVMVKGKVTEYADSQLARFKSDGGRAVWRTLNDTEAVLHLRHPNGDEHTETFTIEDAKKAGLAGPGSMYQKYPRAMLRSRAITAGIKSVGWEGGVGMYDPDELAHVAPPAVQEEERPAPAAHDPARIPASPDQVEQLRRLAGHSAVPTPVREKVLEKLTKRMSMARAADLIEGLSKTIAEAKPVDVPTAEEAGLVPADDAPALALDDPRPRRPSAQEQD